MTDSTNENGGSPAWREEMEGLIRKATEELERQGYNEDLDLARQREVAVQLLGMAAQQPGPAGEFWRAVMSVVGNQGRGSAEAWNDRQAGCAMRTTAPSMAHG